MVDGLFTSPLRSTLTFFLFDTCFSGGFDLTALLSSLNPINPNVMTTSEKKQYVKHSTQMSRDGQHIHSPYATDTKESAGSSGGSSDDLAWCLARCGATREEIHHVTRQFREYRLLLRKLIYARRMLEVGTGSGSIANAVGKGASAAVGGSVVSAGCSTVEECLLLVTIEADETTMILNRPISAEEFGAFLHAAKHKRKQGGGGSGGYVHV